MVRNASKTHKQRAESESDDDYHPTTSASSDHESDKDSPADSGDDGNTPSALRKRPLTTKVALPKKKRLVQLAPPRLIQSTLHTSKTAPRQRVLRLTPSQDTILVNKWLDARPSLSVEDPVPPNDLNVESTHVMPLSQRPDMPNRLFQYKIECVPIEVTWDPLKKRSFQDHKPSEEVAMIDGYYKVIKTWRIHVWNSALPSDQQIQLRLFPEWQETATLSFKSYEKREKYHRNKTTTKSYNMKRSIDEPKDRYKFFRAGGPLDINVCPNKSDASRVAAEACSLLNKYPLELNDSDFPEELPVGFKAYSGVRTLIELVSLRVIRKDFDFRALRFIFRSQDQVSGSYCLYPMADLIRGDGTAILYDILIPTFMTNGVTSRWTRIRFTDEAFAQESFDALPDVPAWWGFRPSDPTNDPLIKQAKVPVKNMMKLITWFTWKIFGYVGSRDAMHLAPRDMITEARTRRKHVTGPYKGKLLFTIEPKSGRIGVSAAVAKTISGTVPQANTSIPHTAQALALQSAYEVFKRGEGILDAIEELFVALDELRLGKSVLSKEAYCQCLTETQKDASAHYCMLCFKLEICSKMSRTADDRLVCLVHFKDGPPASENYILRRVKIKVRNCENRARLRLPAEERQKMERRIVQDYILSGLIYRDAYDGVRHEEYVAQCFGPCVHSLDAVFPLWVVKGSAFIHHAENTVLTTYFTNMLKGTDIPLVLPSAREAIERKDDNVYLSDIELAFDHYYKIRLVVPFPKDDRKEIAAEQPKNWWPRYLKMMKSGVYDGTPLTYDFDWITWFVSNEWSQETIMRLDRICKEIENDPLLNPNKLVLPRGGKAPRGCPGAPWLWNPNHMFSDHDWRYLARVFASRFKRMDETCDWANDHDDESEETLFLTCVVLWYQLDGGKDEVIGVRMSVFKRHPLRWSIGRALHVKPGSIMVTGWGVKHPVSLSQYTDSRRTITMETWMMNRGKFNFPTNPETIAKWSQIIREFSKTSEFWYTYPPKHTQRHIQWPKSWEDRRLPGESNAEENGGPIADHELDVDEDDANPYDEDNEGLVMEAEGEELMGSTSSLTEADVAFLTSMVTYLPKAHQQQYDEIMLKLKAQAIESMLSGIPDTEALQHHDFEQRLSLFIAAITEHIGDLGQSDFIIEDLVKMPLSQWQSVTAEIQSPFTREEIETFCRLLQEDSSHLRYFPDEDVFSYKL
ncbi:Nn.00g020220.m01.CDS01 [Neocucurbitaria sp. VM-36]